MAGHVSNLERTEQFNQALLNTRKNRPKLMPAHKRSTIEERVRWGDVDAARIIFYGAYIHFFEYAETELFREVGLHYGVMFDELKIWLPACASRVRLSSRGAAGRHFRSQCLVARRETSRWLNFEVRRKGEDELVATAHFKAGRQSTRRRSENCSDSDYHARRAPYTATKNPNDCYFQQPFARWP